MGIPLAAEVMRPLREAATTSQLHKRLEPVLRSVAEAITDELIRGRGHGPKPLRKGDRHRLDAIRLDGIDDTLKGLRSQIDAALCDTPDAAVRIEWWLE